MLMKLLRYLADLEGTSTSFFIPKLPLQEQVLEHIAVFGRRKVSNSLFQNCASNRKAVFLRSVVMLRCSGDWTDCMCWRGVGMFMMPLGRWL